MNKAPKWFQEFEKRNNKRLDSIDLRLKNIEKTPTMKKELKK